MIITAVRSANRSNPQPIELNVQYPTAVLPAVGRTTLAAICAPPIFQVNRCGTSENTSWTNTTAPAIPTSWIAAAPATQPPEAAAIADRTPPKPGRRLMTPIAMTTSTTAAMPPRISFFLMSPEGGDCERLSDPAPDSSRPPAAGTSRSLRVGHMIVSDHL